MSKDELIEEIHNLKRSISVIQAERRINESYQEKYVDLINGSLDGFAMLDVDGHFTTCNAIYCEILGYTFDELKTKTYAEITPLEYHEIDKIELNKMFERGYSDLYEKEYLNCNGRRIPIEIRSYLIKDRDGHFAGTWSYVRDISERLRQEQEKQLLESQLQQAQKLESVGRLAGGVAHDFNNMLGVILGHAEMAIQDSDSSLPILSDLLQIQQAADRSADITKQLLSFARKQIVTPKVIDLNDTIAGMLRMLLRLIGEDVDFSWSPGKGLWSIVLDPSQIDQILANLCVNSRDAIAGVGKITIVTENCTISEEHCSPHSSIAPGQYVKIEVSDNGCGIEKETVDLIFEPFFTTKSVNEGTGLGLATVYGIVKQNEGYIYVCSELGKGTTFTIYFPRHDDRTSQRQLEPITELALGGHETILLVEDDPLVLKLTTVMLQRLGYDVLKIGGPSEALRLSATYPDEIHLLITDVIMPEMNGRILTDKLLLSRPEMKHLFMSGYTADVISHHGVLSEDVNFIRKPFSQNELAAKIRQVLGDSN